MDAELRARIAEVAWANIVANVETWDRSKQTITVTAANVAAAVDLALIECCDLDDAQSAVRVAKQATGED